MHFKNDVEGRYVQLDILRDKTRKGQVWEETEIVGNPVVNSVENESCDKKEEGSVRVKSIPKIEQGKISAKRQENVKQYTCLVVMENVQKDI